MKVALITLLALSCAGFSSPGNVRSAERQYIEGGHPYVVEYLYATDAIEHEPLELTTAKIPSKIHYDAEISVFDVTSGVRVPVGEPFAGLYTFLGCIEDVPMLLVDRAQASQRSRKMGAQSEPVTPPPGLEAVHYSVSTSSKTTSRRTSGSLLPASPRQ